MFHTKHCAHHSVYKKLDTCSCTLFHFSHQTLYHHSVYEKINIWIQHFSHHTLCTSLVVLRLQIYSCTALFTPYIVHATRRKFHSHHTLCTLLIRSFTLVHCTFHTIHCAHHLYRISHSHCTFHTIQCMSECEISYE